MFARKEKGENKEEEEANKKRTRIKNEKERTTDQHVENATVVASFR